VEIWKYSVSYITSFLYLKKYYKSNTFEILIPVFTNFLIVNFQQHIDSNILRENIKFDVI